MLQEVPDEQHVARDALYRLNQEVVQREATPALLGPLLQQGGGGEEFRYRGLQKACTVETSKPQS